jgi:hypothetical protein
VASSQSQCAVVAFAKRREAAAGSSGARRAPCASRYARAKPPAPSPNGSAPRATFALVRQIHTRPSHAAPTGTSAAPGGASPSADASCGGAGDARDAANPAPAIAAQARIGPASATAQPRAPARAPASTRAPAHGISESATAAQATRECDR